MPAKRFQDQNRRLKTKLALNGRQDRSINVKMKCSVKRTRVADLTLIETNSCSSTNPILRKAAQRRFFAGFPEDDFVDATGQLQIVVSDSLHAMRPQFHGHLCITEIQVGMVPSSFGNVSDGAR